MWTIATTPRQGDRFATFAKALVEPYAPSGSRPDPIVFEPCVGSDTVTQVASQLGRHYLCCELSPEYSALQHNRTRQPACNWKQHDRPRTPSKH